MRGTGRRRAGVDNLRLRQEIGTVRADLTWYQRRLKAVTARCRALAAQVEIADGQLVLAEQLVQRQVMQLMERDAEIERLHRQLKADAVRTQEIPVIAAAELAGVA
ncbi:hypothetical protein [Streptomyces canus]|uniref:hypothetical protein n=1 Tax=Streptomyces canus TaxID=58343 RepID=UPI0027812A6D|nr:hypothetical protein [Streptomyces canus]MDQ0758763.1 hypothetical protein [Streptomyces canus]